MLNITLQCPLRCDHCCYRSDMSVSEVLSACDIERAVVQAAAIDSIATVHLVGGDPFLHPELIRTALSVAARYGIVGAATTSAFFAKSRVQAIAVLAPLVAAGLREITISYDDMHSAYVPERFIVNAVEAARALSLSVLVAVTLGPDAKIDAEYIRRLCRIENGNLRERVYEVTVNSTGRANDQKDPDSRAGDIRGTYRGPCHSALQSIQVTDRGRVIPCCGVLPHSKEMFQGDIAEQDGVGDAVRRAYDDPLWRWIAFEGPIDILKQVTADDREPLRPEMFDGICTACDRLFNDAQLLARARQAAVQKEAMLKKHETILRAIGKFAPPPPQSPAAVAATPNAECFLVKDEG